MYMFHHLPQHGKNMWIGFDLEINTCINHHNHSNPSKYSSESTTVVLCPRWTTIDRINYSINKHIYLQHDDGTVWKCHGTVTGVCPTDGGHEYITEDIILQVFTRMKKDLSKKWKRSQGLIKWTHLCAHTHAHTHNRCTHCVHTCVCTHMHTHYMHAHTCM